jgi:hypothetical protein
VLLCCADVLDQSVRRFERCVGIDIPRVGEPTLSQWVPWEVGRIGTAVAGVLGRGGRKATQSG